MAPLNTIKNTYSYKPFNATFPAWKEHLVNVRFTIWGFTLSGFNVELDSVIFIDSGFKINYLRANKD